MRILLLDTETSPNLAFVWGLFKQNVALNQIKQTGSLLCYAAKWYGEDNIYFQSSFADGEKKMLKGIHSLLNEADVVVHYNGKKFDIPVLNTAFISNGMKPPAPYKQVDLLSVARTQFRFTSNKMDFVSQYLGLGAKQKTNFELWTGCLAKDPESWQKMEEYNIEDLMILERMYDELKPWIKNHPNHGLYNEEGNELVCPSCGGSHYQRRGFSYASTRKYQRYQCKDCGSWFKGVKSLGSTTVERFGTGT